MTATSLVELPKPRPVGVQLPSSPSIGRSKSQSRIKAEGVVYTPARVVTSMVEMLGLRPHHTIIEPSCGHGAFLFGLLEHARLAFGLDRKELLAWFTSKVTGLEISSQTIMELRNMLVGYFETRGLKVSPHDFKNVHCLDSLTFSPEREYDFCLGNPPYVRTKHIEASYLRWLRGTFASCASGNIDLYFAFIEKFAGISKQVCFITPNGFIGSSSGKALRQIVEPRLTRLIDFKDKLIFPNARTYTCIFKLGTAAQDDFVMFSNDLDEIPVATPRAALFGTPNCEATADSFGPVLSGLCTLCDAAFTVKKDGESYFAECNERQFEIEAGIVVPSLKLTKQRDCNFGKIKYMLYPYDEHRNIIGEADLIKKYPRAHAYLCAQRPKLEQRDKGHGHYEAWYAYGRKQGLAPIRSNEVVTVPGMIGGACGPVRLNISTLLAKFRTVVFTGGYLIPVTDSNKRACDGIFSLNFAEFTNKHGKPWAGSYYSLSAKLIRAFLSTYAASPLLR